jgi:outer membrane protein OmpA-like peptidoglycan-associated protein
MNRKQFIITAIAAFFVVSMATAQEDTRDVLKSYSFIEAQGGLQLTATDAPMSKLFTPTAAISFGHYVFPSMGFRLHLNGPQAKSGFSDTEQYYKWKYITTSADLLVNLTNLFGEYPQHLLNVILVGGVGLNYAWDNDELKALNADPREVPLMWDKNRLSHNLRAGLRLETNPAKPLGLSLEVNANSLDDRFNSKTNDSDDWMFTAMLGVSFRFGHKYCQCKKAPEPAPVVKPEPKPEPKPVVVEKKTEPKPVVKTEKKAVVKQEAVKLHKEVFYQIRENTDEQPATAIKEVADFMKNHKDAKVEIRGYASPEGNPELNQKLSQNRANAVKNALINKYGIAADRLSAIGMGATDKLFEEVEFNRVATFNDTKK